ncbi:MAG: prepilin-type N-terminal cleavage/methylation domain-containing protein [Elusimicrobiaceae bacterium]|nr:prepilin-type N-terminal cleavage/methylation domain-containing protein [Elusimicrobiaceae bacterium]
MKISNKKGFSLVELLAVVLILAIITMIAIPMYQRSILRSHTAEVNNLLVMVRTRQARRFAQTHEYATAFTDSAVSKIALGPQDYEQNNGRFKTVNTDYELELRTGDAGNCVIGRYKPNGGNERFALAIAYTKNGLACQDGPDETWSVCNSLGTAVVGDIDEVCAGEAPDPNPCTLQCGECQYLDIDSCRCVDNPPLNFINSNYEFNPNVTGCQSCRYCTGEDCPANKRVSKTIDTASHTVTSFPTVSDTIFPCTNIDLTLGDPVIEGCAEDIYEGETCNTPIYKNCHSAYYKEWNQNDCNWFCNNTGSNEICLGDQIWSNNVCGCTCRPGSTCFCHASQIFENGSCKCSAQEAVFISQDTDPGCECAARSQFGEDQGDRPLTADYTHCRCGDSRQPVFFGTVTDKRGGEHEVHIADATTLIEENRYWEAACCLNEDVWKKEELNGFDYDACCPYPTENNYKQDNSESRIHVAFNISQQQCCPSDEMFYNDADTNQVVNDLKTQYSNRPAGIYATQICHQCREWFHAYNDEIGCHACPGKTFTTWNSSEKISECSCPTGTEGQAVVIQSGIATETCQCTKANTHWDTSVAWIADATTRTAWHVNNGACKCNTGFFDTYYGLEITSDTADSRERAQNLGSNTIQDPFARTSNDGNKTTGKEVTKPITNLGSVNIGGTISYDNGFCCPKDFRADVLNDNNASTGELACCPTNKPFFHKTNFARNTCGVCQNQTHTYVNGNCQPCPGKMVPVYNEDLGYALCTCPTGTESTGASTPLATTTDICECTLTHSTWQAPSSDWLTPYINNHTVIPSSSNGGNGANGNVSNTQIYLPMPGNWSDINGYCDCSSGFEFADHGFVDNTTIGDSGYCCQTEASSGMSSSRFDEHFWTSNANPAERFCCNSNVAFNPESPNAQCCSTKYYYSLSTLSSDFSNLQAEIGGCGACSNPQQTWTQEDQCQDCEYPKVPKWNNDPSFGYSNCSCPVGSQEVQDPEPPSWWQSFLELLGLGTSSGPETRISAVLGHCQCTDPNSVWVNGICQCPDGFKIDSESGYCCPTNKPHYWGNTCHLCLSTEYEYGGACHACPEGQYSVAGQCCPNEVNEDFIIDNQIHFINTPAGPRCSVCPEGLIYSGGECIVAPSSEVCDNISVNLLGQTICTCDNGAIWSQQQGCACESNDYEKDPCACNQCESEHHTSDSRQHFQWSPLWNPNKCSCEAGRIFNPSCCTTQGVECCLCAPGMVETFYGSASSLVNGCCPAGDIAPNNSQACCGKTTNGINIAYNTADQTCCPSSAPYWSEALGKCSKCPNPDVQWYDTEDSQCKSCPSPKEIGSWNDYYYAYTTCACPVGTAPNGLGDPLSADGQESRVTQGSLSLREDVCKCLTAGTEWSVIDNKCVCKSGTTLYAQDGATVSACCPNGVDLNNNTCCPSGTTWNASIEGGKCVKCPQPTSQIVPNCNGCSDIMRVDMTSWNDNAGGYTSCKCPVGAVDNTGDVIRYLVKLVGGEQIMNSSCKCPYNQHFVDSNFEQAYYQNVDGRTTEGLASCQQCPPGSVWLFDNKTNKSRCQCQNGFVMVNGSCQCTGVAFSLSTLQGCDPSTSGGKGINDCVCKPTCPTNTFWCNDACRCEYKDTLSNHPMFAGTAGGDTNYGVKATFSTTQNSGNAIIINSNNQETAVTLSNEVWLGGSRIGYCNFYCEGGDGRPVLNSQNIWLCGSYTTGSTCSAHGETQCYTVTASDPQYCPGN